MTSAPPSAVGQMKGGRRALAGCLCSRLICPTPHRTEPHPHHQIAPRCVPILLPPAVSHPHRVPNRETPTPGPCPPLMFALPVSTRAPSGRQPPRYPGVPRCSATGGAKG
ncbi:hypothetical protein DPEC_G00214970 [Dallia pectoralis]|uniref:Uncharacterized protein n=1 Tax=Dallia pectoralis TaxID=75939 RepID=A0ACC2G2E0_DALPE|nr:hypothetical protein DPEC_G00214970 [Dallia pectoralis]